MVDETIVVERLEHVNQYTNELREIQNVSKDAYLDDVVYSVQSSDRS